MRVTYKSGLDSLLPSTLPVKRARDSRSEWNCIPLRRLKMSDSNRASASQAQRASHYTTFSSATPTGIEPVPPDRQSGVLTVILWSYFPQADRRIPARLPQCILFLSTLNCDSIYNHDFIHGHIQDGCQDYQVVNGWHGSSVDPLVDRLRSRKTEDHLHISYRQSSRDTQPVDVLSGCDSVNKWQLQLIAPPVFRQSRHRQGRLYCLILIQFLNEIFRYSIRVFYLP